MTVLSALQSASIRLVGQKPTAFFSATRGIEVELCDLLQEASADIAKAHDWSALTALGTLEGDGVLTEFDLPGDYDRMPRKAKVWSTAWPGLFFERARTLDEWYFNQTFVNTGAPGWWIILSGKFAVFPATSGNIQFYYQSNKFVRENDGERADAFGADDDSFLLPERLLTLSLIWRWRSQKRLEYAEDMRNFEIALSQEISSDKGSRILAEGSARMPVPTAYPGVLGQ